MGLQIGTGRMFVAAVNRPQSWISRRVDGAYRTVLWAHEVAEVDGTTTIEYQCAQGESIDDYPAFGAHPDGLMEWMEWGETPKGAN